MLTCMVAEIKSVCLIDGLTLEEYHPLNPENFAVTLRFMVGQRGQAGEESLDFVICTPAALADECMKNGFVFGRHRLVVARYDPSLIVDAVGKAIKQCDGTSWAAIGSKLSRYGYWEFEDYQDAY